MATYMRDMLIRDVLTSHEMAATVFHRHGLGCAGCIAADMETLESVAVMHDIDPDDLIRDLNAMEAPAEESET